MTQITRYCNECKWGIINRRDIEVSCMHPQIESINSYSLSCSDASYRGSSCRIERRKTFWLFPKCGQVGKLWEPKELVVPQPDIERTQNELPF